MNARFESPNLDFLRSIAVLYVLIFHLLLYFQYLQHSQTFGMNLSSLGHLGVLIFFVHTSLVLMFSLERQQKGTQGQPVYFPFLIRRFFRIYPLSIFVVLIIILFRISVEHLRAGQFFSQPIHLPEIFSNLLLVQDISGSDSVEAPLATLPYEMQMYLVLPFFYLLARSLRSVWPLLPLWFLTFFLGLESFHFERHHFPDFLVYLPCFFSGIIAYKLTSQWHLQLPSFVWPICLAALTLFYLWQPSKPRSWIVCLLLGIVLPQFREISSPFMRRMCQLIARYSYGIYLSHFIFIWLAFQELHKLSRIMQWGIFLLSSVLAPVLLYHVLEAPMVRIGQRLAARCVQKAPFANVVPG